MANELVVSERSVVVGYGLLALAFFGVFGLHRIYSGRVISGLIWFFTFGLCGVGQFIDVFFLPRMIEDHNAGRPVW